jgi:23S rRNA (guanine745-N1)-methyltransferase
MHAEVLAQLRCPICRQGLRETTAGLQCARGHAFDRARQGYVNFLAGRRTAHGDSADMIAARAAVLGAGHFLPLAQALAQLAADSAPAEGLLIEVGAGTAYYLASVLNRLPGRHGLAIDVSPYAARRAAKAHPDIDAAVVDVRAGALPLADASTAVALDVFAPRNAPELRRVLRADGVLLVVTPQPEHLHELRQPLGLLEVDPDKDRRLADTLGAYLIPAQPQLVTWTLELGHEDVQRFVAMGPSSRHMEPVELAQRVAALSEPAITTAAVSITVWRPRFVEV